MQNTSHSLDAGSSNNQNCNLYEEAVAEWDKITPLPIIQLFPSTNVVEIHGVDDAEESDIESTGICSLTSTVHPTQLVTGEEHEDPEMSSTNLSSETLHKYIHNLNLSSELPHIKRSIRRKRGILYLFRKALLIGPEKVRRTLRVERDRIFALALRHFDNNDAIHIKMLNSLYHKLTRQSFARCPRIGSHWENIGFQGIDPVTDLRGVGLLGLYQLTFFAINGMTERLAKDIYALSMSTTQSFPFAIMGLNITQICLHCLRQGLLNREINRRGSPVILTFNLFYASLFMKFFRLWKDNNHSIADTAFVLKELRSVKRKDVRRGILAILSYGENFHKEMTDTSVVFSDIGNILAEDLKGDNEVEEREIV